MAFPAKAIHSDRDRYLTICEAYLAGLPHTSEFEIPTEEQMVTVWPIDNKDLAELLNYSKEYTRACEMAVDNYGLKDSRDALIAAGYDVDNRDHARKKLRKGPYLLAWSPAIEKGKRDVLVLSVDLSDINDPDDAKQVFLDWSEAIESDPETWEMGWSVDLVRTKLRHWLNDYGPKFFSLVGVKK